MTNHQRKPNAARLRTALEKTVPSSEFSVEGTRRELERTTARETPSPTPQQYLAKTETDSTGSEDIEDSSPIEGFSTTSLVPPELVDQDSPEQRTRFEITGEAGRGGNARVYRLLDHSLGRTIALKLLRGKARHKREVKQRFIHEAHVTATLEHPNIVPVYDNGVTDDNRL
jgi:serine/threonine-protein kinase